jgi:hypothetical protein
VRASDSFQPVSIRHCFSNLSSGSVATHNSPQATAFLVSNFKSAISDPALASVFLRAFVAAASISGGQPLPVSET